ncbi:hypothetical protein ACA910_001938 [Epithemia clementina (nom. ined.)]
MRQNDVSGSPTRLKAVWKTIALDFIAHRLISGNAGPYDLVSIVTFGESAKIIVETAPTSWTVYNKVFEMYAGKGFPVVEPKGHGYYICGLKAAENILTQNKCASCALALVFISDGRPSDFVKSGDVLNNEIMATVESLGQVFGRRLAFTTVAIGSNDKRDDFETLQAMVNAAEKYGVHASFELPSMSSAALGDVLTKTATTLTNLQTEMANLLTSKQLYVRDVVREPRKRANEENVIIVSKSDYHLYPIKFCSRYVYSEWHDKERRRHDSWDRVPPQNPATQSVAIHKYAFGEGAERFAFRFFEVDGDGKTVLGKPLVAKESRLVLEGGVGGQEAFVQSFCRTQQLARRIASEFNEKLLSLRCVSDSTPCVTFLDCSVYHLNDSDIGKRIVLVEEKLDITSWHKWNTNNGFIEGMKEAPKLTHQELREACNPLTKSSLEAIEEVEQEEDGDDEELGDHGCVHRTVPITFSASEVAQAFSHFSHQATGKKRLICDLQGVFDEKENLLKFSDPVIHYYNPGKTDKRTVHGRTDLGQKGMFLFFKTHKDCCGHLCRLVTRGFRPRRHHHLSHKS